MDNNGKSRLHETAYLNPKIREDRDGQTSGLPVVPPGAPLGI